MMGMARIETWLECDLDKMVQVVPLRGNVFTADNEANLIGVSVKKGGQPVALTGGCNGYVIRQDGYTVAIAGTVSENKAYIVLSASCYVVPGRIDIVIKNGTTTLAACSGIVTRTTTDAIVDPGHLIPSIEELLAKIGDCEAATTAANTAAGNANTKAALADEKATLADQKATAANTAAGAANTAAGTANAAATKIDDMTVAASGLAAGASPTVQISEVSGHKHLAFGIPKGDTGEVPDIKVGTVTTLQPDQPASVTRRSGSPDEEPIFDFALPKGETGSVENVYGTTIEMSSSDTTKVATAIGGKTDKVQNATSGNLAGLDANGNLTDSGYEADDFADAADTEQALTDVSSGMAIVVDGDTAPRAIASGAYLFIKNHSTLASGGYHATAAIASGGTVSSSNVAADSDGIANSLNEQMANLNKSSHLSGSSTYLTSYDIYYTKLGNVCTFVCQFTPNTNISSSIGTVDNIGLPKPKHNYICIYPVVEAKEGWAVADVQGRYGSFRGASSLSSAQMKASGSFSTGVTYTFAGSYVTEK